MGNIDENILKEFVNSIRNPDNKKPKESPKISPKKDIGVFNMNENLEDHIVVKRFFNNFTESFNIIFHGTVNSKSTEMYMGPLSEKMDELLSYDIIHDYLRNKPEEVKNIFKKLFQNKIVLNSSAGLKFSNPERNLIQHANFLSCFIDQIMDT